MIIFFKNNFFLFFFYFFFTTTLVGQTIYGCYSTGVNTFIRNLDIQKCTTEVIFEIPDLVSSDLAIHPDGTFYLVGSSTLVNIDLVLGITKSIPLPYNDISGLVSDIDGNLYLAGRNILKFNSLNNQFTNYGPLPADFYCAGDLTVNNGEYFIAAYSDNLLKSAIIKLNFSDVSSSEVLFTDDNKYFIYSLASIYESCGDVTTYGWGNDTNLYEINFITGDVQLVCNNEFYDFGGTSPSEFLASDPECDLLFDLDRNNSSGVYPYDFRIDSILCADSKTTHIVDSDVYLHTSAELDSIIITLSGDLDGASEALAFSHNVPNAALTSTNDRYILTLTSDRSDAAWLNALRAIQYSNISATPSAGLRTITFTAYNAIKHNQAQTSIRLGAQAYAGRDTSIIICASMQINGFSQHIDGQSGGYWSPPFASSDSYNSAIDLATTYHYIVESSDCGLDTATVLIDRLPLRTLDLGPNISICRAERHTVAIPTITGDQVIWSDGNTQANRIFTAPGTYIVSITTTDGCVITDSITISRSYAKIPKTTTINLCEGEIYDYLGQIYQAGETIIDSLEATTGCDTLWTIALNAIAAPTILRDTTTCDNAPIILNNKTYQIGDTIKLLKNSPTGCDTLVQVLYNRYESSVEGVSLSDTLVCKDGTTKATIVASSFSNLLWSNGDQSLNTELGAGTHFLQATDDRGCVRIIPFEIQSFPSIQYEIQATDPSCGQNNGSIVIINNAPDINFSTSINGVITQSLENLPSGKYNITLTYENRCETQDSIILNNVSNLDVTLPSEISGTIGQIISIAYQSSGGSIDTITFSPTADIEWIADSIAVAITGDRLYSITFIDEYGCTVTKTLTINAEIPTSTLILPNIISSQSTNTENTLFYLKTQGITYDMSIYDRWGNLIHSAQKITGGDPSQAWQPSLSKVGPGVYVYLIAIYTDNGIVYKYGTITVI
jgi:hypothetical protein